MTLVNELGLELRRWRRAEYDRLIELGWFQDERLELLDGQIVLRDRQTPPHAATVGQSPAIRSTTFMGIPRRPRSSSRSPTRACRSTDA
jgi:hypothetical protein